MEKIFQNPPSIYRSAPLWVWNDLMDEEQIVFQLKELKTHGFGGAFVHPRPGLMTEYLSEEWFRLWSIALQTAKELNLLLYIYDENSYPSGFAGGHVSAAVPDCLAAGMRHRIVTDANSVKDLDMIRVYVCTQDGGKIHIGEDISLYPPAQWHEHGDRFFVVELVKAKTTEWMGGFAYVDLMRPEVTKQFLNITYDAYFQRFGEDFGKSIPAIFTDEPCLGNFAAPDSLPFSYFLVREFQNRNGYGLLEHLPCIMTEAEGDALIHPSQKVRYDYYSTLHALWTENFVKPIGQWCEEHHIAWTGHYLEHQWPFAHAGHPSPSVQSHYEFHQWPAIDMLMATALRDTDVHMLMLTIQELRSAANQFQKERTLCELYGAGGWDSNFEDYKRMGDWVMVNGINFINQHLTYGTIVGARKRDHPQSFDWRQSWWDEYTTLNDYIARLSFLLSQGTMQQRILLLNPSTTGYLIAATEEQGNLAECPGTDAIQNPDMNLFLETVKSLTDRQWDYDLGDEYTLERNASVRGSNLCVGAQSYEVVIVSGDMQNMRNSTVQLLKAFMQSGGKVIACKEPGDYVDGLHNPAAYESLRSRWTKAASLPAMQEELLRVLAPRIGSSNAWISGVAHMRRVLPDGRELYFFVNHNKNTFESVLTLCGAGVSCWNLFSGEEEPVAFETEGEIIRFPLTLRFNQSVMLVLDKKSKPAPVSVETITANAPVILAGVKVEEPNMFTMQYCDLHVDGKTYRDIHVMKASDLVYLARGFDGNPWDCKVQYRKRLLEQQSFGENSGFSADYYFTAGEGFWPEDLSVVAEQPDLFDIWINGEPVPWQKEPSFMDHHFGMADIAAHVRPGKNKVTVVAGRFDVRMELEAVYLRGSFSATIENGEWVLQPIETMQYGSWAKQGYPFYPGAAQYRYVTTVDKAVQTALLEVDDYGASALSLTVNGKPAGLINADGKRPIDIAPYFHAGENEMIIRVCGSMKSLLGPHFMQRTRRGIAWPDMWKEAPVFGEPSAEQYDLMDFGLTKEPVLFIG